MNVLNRPLFQRYARQPMMQQPMMQQPVGIMASSPELMQASMGYNQGGPVRTYSDPFLNPSSTVDITQDPIEFQETVTETVGPETVGGFTEEGLAQEVEKYSDSFLNPDVPSEPKPEASDADTLSKAEQLGAQAIDNGELNPDTASAPLADAVNTLNDPDKTPTEEADAILAGMGKNAPKGTKGKIGAMKDLIRDTFGVDASRYDNLKALNRAAVGFAIAKGDDIAAALERGAQGAAAIEEKSLARDDSMSQMALQQVFAERNAALKASAKAPKTFLDTPEGEAALKIYQDYLKSNLSEANARAKVNEIAPGLGDRVAAAIAGGVPSTTTKATEGVDISQTAGGDVRVQEVTQGGKKYRVYSDGRPAELVE